MRSKSMKKMKIAAPALVAAAFGAWVGIPTAQAGFVVTFANGGQPLQTSGGYSDYVLQALNDGSASSAYTGTTLAALDVTITTSGGADLGVEVTSTGSGSSKKYTANVDGQDDANSAFGQVAYGTFIGIGSGPLSTISVPDTEGGTQGVYTNGQTNVLDSANSFNSGTPAKFKGQTSSNFDAAFQPVNGTGAGNVANGSLQALEVTEVAASGSGDTEADSSVGPIPFANIVVPSGTQFTVIAQLAGETGPNNLKYSISNSVSTGPTGAILTLTSAPTHSADTAGTLTVTGSDAAGYVAAKLPGTTQGAITGTDTTTGNVQTTGFQSSTDDEVFALAVDSSPGVLATGSALTSAISDLSAAVTSEGGIVAPLASPSSSMPASANITSLFNPTFWNVEVTFPNGVPAGDPYLNWDFSGDTVDAGLSITDVGVVPEPTGVGVLVLGGMGLLARRRRMSLEA